MPWQDMAEIEAQLSRALDTFDWSAVEDSCDTIIARIKREPDPMPDRSARFLMNVLRRKQQFQLMTRLAETLYQCGVRTPQVRRQYAQALIDQGMLAAAEMVLQTIIQDPQGLVGEEMEARGLTGRIYKQLYVNNNDPKSPINRANLERALKEYLYVYRLNTEKNLWHGINVVALVARARRDRLPVAGLPDELSLAQEILDTIAKIERESVDGLAGWDIATAMEAYVALGLDKEAVSEASRYLLNKGADAFELASTIRQLTEVWQLNEQEPPGNLLLPICRAGHFSRQGATIKNDPTSIRAESAAASAALEAIEGEGLEAVFGADMMVTLGWYKKGLVQCDSLARIEELNGKPHGTGWLVNASEFFPERNDVLLLTNEHVISTDKQHPVAILPGDARANFRALGEIFKIKEVVWSSSYREFDATFVTIEGQSKAGPLELHSTTMEMTKPPKSPPRMYIIGFPAGRDVELSLQDNSLLACNEKLLHYRTPTQRGSSGSPVFEPTGWRVVGLHHKGLKDMPRIDGEAGTYKANEGIAIPALQNATRTPKVP